jgi:RNA polymerase sigma factor (sigma-70 family)
VALALDEDGIDSRLRGLMARYRRLVVSVISAVGGPALRDSREDVEQQVWVSMWRRLQGEDEIDHPTSYLYAAARHAALRAVQDRLARLNRTGALPEAAASQAFDPHRQAVARETGEAIRDAVRKLSPDRRRAIEAFLSGLEVREIQDLFGWSYERTRNLITRGRADLRVLLLERMAP